MGKSYVPGNSSSCPHCRGQREHGSNANARARCKAQGPVKMAQPKKGKKQGDPRWVGQIKGQ